MTDDQPVSDPAPIADHAHGDGLDEVGHTHADVSGGQLRAAAFGAMDGLVTNLSLVAGVGGAGVGAHTVVLSGVAGLIAGAFSMAMGEYSSVSTQNQQVIAEVRTEKAEFRRHPDAEHAELVELLVDMGMSETTAEAAATEIHTDTDQAVNFHLTHELGVDPSERPSPLVAAGSSFVMFCIGAVIPLIPYLLGFDSLAAGLLLGAVGLLVVGGVAAKVTAHPVVWGAIKQLLFGAVAAGATYLVGYLIGTPGVG